MELKAQIRKLSLWIFFIALISVNLCLFISVNYNIFLGTFLEVDPIGRSGFTFPYIDGGVSISRTARTYPTYLIFKPGMFIVSILLIIYWIKANEIINYFSYKEKKDNLFKTFGILSAVFLICHSLLLGIKLDYDFYKFFRRFVLLAFIIFEIIAQSLLVYKFFKMKEVISKHINRYALKLKILLVSALVLIAILSIPVISTSGNTHIKHALEWNYFLGVITFYLLTFLMWKKN